MTTLFDYMKEAQELLRESGQSSIEPGSLIRFINRARREVAMRSQSIRILTPISGQIIDASIVAAGTGYTAPTVVITAPDFPSGMLPKPNGDQATGVAFQTGGSISSIGIPYGGYGYYQPQITITDPTGTGASITPVMSGMNLMAQGQEVYPFTQVDLSPFPGVDSIISIRSVSILYSNYRYSLPVYSFSTYQAMIRQYPYQYQWVPTFAAQYGQGDEGSFYLYPLPSQPYQMEWDCFCWPSDLDNDQTVERLQKPWTDAVAYFACYLAYLSLQNLNSARIYLDLFDREMKVCSVAARPGRWVNPYGRW